MAKAANLTKLSSTCVHILRLLADGKLRSGEELGAAVEISRAAIAKHIKRINALGLSVESVRGKGYRLLNPIDLLEEASIRQACGEEAAPLLKEVKLFEEIDSTNAYLMGLAAAGSAHGVLCAAESQSQGRGRRGRLWHSPFAQNIYLSVAWRVDGGVAQLEGLSLAVGVVISEVLESLGVNGVGLKWPNDIFIDGKKLGGVLVELSGDLASDCTAIVGVGLNVQMNDKADSSIDQPWANLREYGYRGNRNALVGRLAAALLGVLDAYRASGFAAYQQRWNMRSIYRDVMVKLVSGSTCVTGQMRGVSPRGELLLLKDGKLEPYSGGELSLRVSQ